MGLVLILAGLAQGWDRYQVIDLGTLGGDESWAYGINDNGQIVGQSQKSSSVYHAFLWESGTGMKDIYIPGTSMTGASDINNAGQVVGPLGIGGAPAINKAYRWSESEGITYLAPSLSTYATAINSTGRVCGNIYPNNHGFYWDEAQGLTDINTLGGSLSDAHGINDANQVVGGSFTAQTKFHAFVWDSANGMVDLLPGFPSSCAQDINNNGKIIGYLQYEG